MHVFHFKILYIISIKSIIEHVSKYVLTLPGVMQGDKPHHHENRGRVASCMTISFSALSTKRAAFPNGQSRVDRQLGMGKTTHHQKRCISESGPKSQCCQNASDQILKLTSPERDGCLAKHILQIGDNNGEIEYSDSEDHKAHG